MQDVVRLRNPRADRPKRKPKEKVNREEGGAEGEEGTTRILMIMSLAVMKMIQMMMESTLMLMRFWMPMTTSPVQSSSRRL